MISIVLKGVHHAASLLNSVMENHVFMRVFTVLSVIISQ